MNESEVVYTLEESFNNIKVVFINKKTTYSFEAFYKEDFFYKEDITGVTETILEKVKDFSVEEKWNYYFEFFKNTVSFYDCLNETKKYTELQVFVIVNVLGKISNVLKDDFEKARTYNGEKKKQVLFDSNLLAALQNERPIYIKKMIDEGILYPNGKRVVKKLSDVASFLSREKIEVSAEFLKENFLNTKGKPYSLQSCKKAINIVNTR
jgi:hypothetical protein